MSKLALRIACVVIGALAACGDDSSSGWSGGPPFGADAGNEFDGAGGSTSATTYNDVAKVAAMIYDAALGGEDVTPHLEAVFEALRIPVLDSDDVEGAQARIAAGLPLVTARLVERMAQAYAEGNVIGVEGYLDGLAEQKVETASFYEAAGASVGDLLGATIYGWAATAQAQPDLPMESIYVLPTLVWALGQERAARGESDTGIDPIWGDQQLDPLQFTLLNATIFSKPATGGTQGIAVKTQGLTKVTAAIENPAAGFIKDQIKDALEGQVTSAVQDVVEVPLDKGDAAKVSVCGSLILYGHKVAITNTPALLWRAPLTPNTTLVEMTLTFEDDYYDNWARAVLGSTVTDLTGCKFPRKGPIEGKAIEWSVSEALESQGSFDVTQQVTDEFGKAVATWRTIESDIPMKCHVFDNQRDAVGATEAVVSGLLPGWSTVERVVTFLNPKTGGQGDATLTVMFYELDADDTCHVE